MNKSFWQYPNKVLAHRGGGMLAPENTLAALRCGVQHGFRAVEFDVMLSKDSIAVLMHDDVLGRTVKGFGAVAECDIATLLTMDAGSWFSSQFTGERIPTYWQAMSFCRAHDVWMNVEIKPAPGFEAVTGRVVGLLTRQFFEAQLAVGRLNRPENLPLLSSFSKESLLAAKEVAPDIARAYLVDVIPDDWETCLLELGASAIHTNQAHLTQEQALAIKQAGFGLLCYTVNDPKRAKVLAEWGVDAICTDQLNIIDAHFFDKQCCTS